MAPYKDWWDPSFISGYSVFFPFIFLFISTYDMFWLHSLRTEANKNLIFTKNTDVWPSWWVFTHTLCIIFQKFMYKHRAHLRRKTWVMPFTSLCQAGRWMCSLPKRRHNAASVLKVKPHGGPVAWRRIANHISFFLNNISVLGKLSVGNQAVCSL